MVDDFLAQRRGGIRHFAGRIVASQRRRILRLPFLEEIMVRKTCVSFVGLIPATKHSWTLFTPFTASAFAAAQTSFPHHSLATIDVGHSTRPRCGIERRLCAEIHKTTARNDEVANVNYCSMCRKTRQARRGFRNRRRSHRVPRRRLTVVLFIANTSPLLT